MINFSIERPLRAYSQEIEFVLKLWAINNNLKINFLDNANEVITIGGESSNLPTKFELVTSQNSVRLNSDCLIQDESGRPDHLATAFYMVNSLQEYDDKDLDDLGRFKYSNSYQYKFQNSNENIVQRCFDEISKTLGIPINRAKTRFLLTHDIDLVNSAIVEDGFNVLKRGRVDLFLQMLFNVVVGKPDWLNIDRILKIENEHDCKSLFFWIVNKGKINAREKNADYSFESLKIQNQLKRVIESGSQNGIHKSIAPDTFNQEFEKYGGRPYSNRYHYLKFNLPQAYDDIADAHLKLDASLGFAEQIGFRNSYGLPFNPYNLRLREPYAFIEAPLHVMDRTYFQYKKFNVVEAGRDIFDFFEKNRENCVLSVLWHNNFFSNYKFNGYFDLYKKILAYLKENDFETITQEEIYKRYSMV